MRPHLLIVEEAVLAIGRSFGYQKNYPLDPPVTVAAGESVLVECTYENPTSFPVTFGDSSKAEMCFAGLYRYPALTGTGCQ